MIYIIPIIIGLLLNRFVSRKTLCLVISILYIGIATLRSPIVGYDTLTYSAKYLNSTSETFNTILNEHSSEPGYYVLCKVLNQLGLDFQVMLFIIAVLSITTIALLVYKYSSSVITSFAMLVPLQFYGFTLSAERQTIAISIILLSVYFIFKRKPIIFLICVFTAYLFHNSALMALPLYFLYLDNLTNKKRASLWLLIPFIYIGRVFILNNALSWMYSDYKVYDSEQGSYMTLCMYFCIWLLYVLTKPNKTTSYQNFVEMCAIIGIMIQMFVPYEPNIYRVAFYYQIFNLILLPEALSNIANLSIRKVGYIVTFSLLSIMYFMFTYYASGINPYFFYWEKI